MFAQSKLNYFFYGYFHHFTVLGEFWNDLYLGSARSASKSLKNIFFEGLFKLFLDLFHFKKNIKQSLSIGDVTQS